MNESVCFIAAADFRTHFKHEDAVTARTTAWDGTDRRVGVTDRRHGHDRRWQAQRERRMFLNSNRRRADTGRR